MKTAACTFLDTGDNMDAKLRTSENIACDGINCTWQFTVDTRMMDLNRVMRPDFLLGLNQQSGEYLFLANGLNNKDLQENGIACVYTRIAVNYERPVMLGEELNLRTALSCRRAYVMKRDLHVYDNIGERVASVFTEAVAMDTCTRSVLRGERCSTFDCIECIECADSPKINRVKLAENMEEVGTYPVLYGDIDYNCHMNNTKYINVLLNFIPDGMSGKWLRNAEMEYHSECRAGEILRVLMASDAEDAYIFSIHGTTRDGNEEEKFRAKVTLGEI